MDKRVVRERMRRKQRQMRMRRYMRLGTYAAVAAVVLIFVVKGVVMPIINSLSGNRSIGTSTEVQANPVAANPDAAIRQPIKGQGDLQKVTGLTPGWHDDETGRWYQNADGTFYTSGFQEIDGVTYCFDDHGYMETGWVTRGAREFYFNDDGSYNADKKRPLLALTYDDGPGQYTETLLNCLKENGAHATFFMVGENVEVYSDIPSKILEAGCELGSHSWDHADLPTISLDAVEDQFTRTDNALISACGQPASVARAPYGDWTQDIIDTVGKPFFTWSLDSLDWSLMDVEKDYDAVINGDLTDGSIILMHDIHEPSVQASLKIIPELVSRGYKLVTVSEMAAAKGVDLQLSSYSDFWQSSFDRGAIAGFNPDAVAPLGILEGNDDLDYADEDEAAENFENTDEGTGEEDFGNEEEGAGEEDFGNTDEETADEDAALEDFGDSEAEE